MSRRGIVAAILPLLVLASVAEASTTFVIPGAAHDNGSEGTVWRTDVWIYNGSGGDLAIPWQPFPSGEPTCVRPAVVPPTVDVPAGATVRLSDVLGDAGRSGVVEVTIPAGVVLRGRTFNVTPAGTLGQGLPVLSPDQLVPAGRTAILAGLFRNPSYRTNLLIYGGIGACAWGGDHLPVTLVLRESSGAIVGEETLWVPNGGQLFVFDPFGAWGNGDCSGCRIDLSATAPFYPFASVIDRATGDPTTISPDF